MSLKKENILDDFYQNSASDSGGFLRLALMYSLSIFVFYLFRDYYLIINPPFFLENHSAGFEVFFFGILIIVCFSLANKIYRINSVSKILEIYQMAFIVFAVFLVARILFFTTSHLFLGLKIIYPKTLIYYFQGLMIAGFMGIIAYNRLRKLDTKKIFFSMLTLLFYYFIMIYINSHFD